MKRYSYIVLCLAALLCGCREEGADVRPGLYIDRDVIDAFGGKEVRISGQASCYTGLSSVSMRCEAWKINEETDLSGQHPVVWNFDYTLVVPIDATFPAEVCFTATDIHGTEMKKIIAVRYSPGTKAPYIEGLQKMMAVDYDTIAHLGECVLKTTLYGEDRLKSAVFDIPAVHVHQVYELSKDEEEVTFTYSFAEEGAYDMTVTVTDNSDNVTRFENKLIVMVPEDLDEIADYPYIWAFKSNEAESDYVFGYYIYTKRLDNYQYEVYVYAESDETAFMFSPTMEVNGERKFGESPFIEERIISMQKDPNYVKGYKPGKGYWGLYLDLDKKIIEKWALDVSEADLSPLYVTGDWNGWTFDAMSPGETVYQQVAEFTIYKGNTYFATAVTTDWKNVWRTWKADGGEFAGWWFSADGGGDGATLPSITEDTEVKMTFDTATKWCTIKKK